jgi:hypothetical protein
MFKILLLLVCFAPQKWVVQKGSTMRVNGTTNVNKFSCVVKDYANPDTLVFYQNNSMSGTLHLPVLSFDCMSASMTEGLRKALNAKEFPQLSISFVSLQRYPSFTSTEEALCGVVNIELAGKSKRVAINYRISVDDQQIIHLVGKQTITFSDFGLIAPRKLGGVIRADDRLDVVFNINCKLI